MVVSTVYAKLTNFLAHRRRRKKNVTIRAISKRTRGISVGVSFYPPVTEETHKHAACARNIIRGGSPGVHAGGELRNARVRRSV